MGVCAWRTRQRRHQRHLHRGLARCAAFTVGWLRGSAGTAPLPRNVAVVDRSLPTGCHPHARIAGRNISLHVRVMHVSVRDRVRQHAEWDAERWGLPISQSAMLLTLLGGSVAPAFGLFLLGHLTSPREMRAVLHFNRYCGHLVGVRCDGYFPETIGDAWRILFMADAARSYDSAESGTELVESFVPAFAPSASHRGLARLRAEYHYRVQAGYLGLYMLPWNRRRYRLPSALPGITLLLLRSPLIVVMELIRRASPGVDRRWQQANVRRWDAWLRGNPRGRRRRSKPLSHCDADDRGASRPCPSCACPSCASCLFATSSPSTALRRCLRRHRRNAPAPTRFRSEGAAPAARRRCPAPARSG